MDSRVVNIGDAITNTLLNNGFPVKRFSMVAFTVGVLLPSPAVSNGKPHAFGVRIRSRSTPGRMFAPMLTPKTA